MTIKEVLATLDPEDSSLWTEDGLPTVEAVQVLMGDENITRAQITEADPDFCRNKALIKNHEPEPEAEMPLEERIRALDEEIQELSVKQDQIGTQIREKSQLRSALQARAFRADTAADDTRGRLEYIKKQNELRAARVAKRTVVVETKAPIDAAMARKTQRGTQRPTLPTLKPSQE